MSRRCYAALLRPSLLYPAVLGCCLFAQLMLLTAQATAAQSATTAKPVAAKRALTSAKQIRMGVHNFPPEFYLQEPDGAPAVCGGPGVEQTARILATAELALVPVCVTPARMYLLLQSGDIDLSINVKSTKALQAGPNQSEHHFAQPPYMDLELMLYSHSRTSQAPTDNSVAAIRGFDYQGQRQALNARGYRLMDVSDATGAIDLFLHFRTEHLISYRAPFDSYLANQAAVPDASRWRASKLSTVPAYYVISAKSPHADLLLQTFEHYAKRHQCRQFSGCQ